MDRLVDPDGLFCVPSITQEYGSLYPDRRPQVRHSLTTGIIRELLRKANLGGRVISGPMTFSVGGRQYVAVAAGNSLFSFALRQ